MEPEITQKTKPSGIKRFIKGSSKNGLLLLITIIVFSLSWIAIATFTQNDNQGFFLVDFNGNQDGIVSTSQTTLRQNIDVDIVAGMAKISGSNTSGFFTTSEIRPASFNGWKNIVITAPVYSTIQDITGSLYTCDVVPVPIPGYQNLQFTGTNLNISISALPQTTYPCIRVRVDMTNTTGNPGLTPLLDWIRVSWNPEPLFLVSVSAPTSVSAGSVYSTTVSYSNSFVDSNGVVVWMELPTYLNGSITNYTTGYNQNPQTSFASATNGGVYTAGGVTVSGINVPPNSVYWNLGTLVAGRSGTLVVRINTGSGWQNGMTLNHVGHIQSGTGQEVISDANTTLDGNQPTPVIVTSSPLPILQKTVSGVATINGVNYVVTAPPLTTLVTYTLMLQNQNATSGRETIFNPIIEDNISDILNKLNTVCGVANPISRVTINNSGSYSATDQTITWSKTLGSFGNILPAGTASVTYTVDYAGCTNGVFNNTAIATGDNFSSVTDSESVTVGIDVTPTGSFAKGDKIGSSQSVIAGVDDNKYVQQTYGDIFSYLLHASNTGAVALGGIVMPDKISTDNIFVSASLPSDVIGGKIYYNLGGSGNSPTLPPAYSITPTGITGAGWTTVAPAIAGDVRWVAFYVPCLNSAYFPSGAGNADCVSQPISVTATITVQIRPIANSCTFTEISNTGNLQIWRASPNVANNSFNEFGVPITSNDVEQTHAGPSLATFSTSSSVTGPNYLQVGNNGTYTFVVSNTGNDTAQNTLLTITIPKINVNGVTRYVNFVGATGGNVTTIIDPLFGQVGTVQIDIGNIAPGSFKTATLTLNLQSGALDNATFDVTGVVTAQDDNNCQNITATVSKETSVESNPLLQAFKTVDERIIPGGDLIHYNINYRNTGTSPSINTYVIDRVPQKTVFDSAYTTGTDTSGTTFTCIGCSVYFSKNTTNLPGSITTSAPITVQDINSYFVLGTQTSPGVWVPSGYPPEEALWIAWRVDVMSLPTPMLPAGAAIRRVGLTVRNDDNNFTPPLIPSPIGTLISNVPGILANDLPQAVDNQVFTTILPDPGLFLEKTSDKEYVRAGETFNWIVEYYNDSGNADTLVNLTDLLPSGVTLTGLFHQWNTTAVSNGLPSSEVSILTDPSVTVAGNQILFSPTTYKAGDLGKLEGGTLRLAMTVQNTVTSGSILTNDIAGHFENPSGSFDVFASDEVYVENPDLWIRKQPDITNPIAGDTVNYTLIVSNEGPHDAPNVLISDTLQAGLCYVGGSTSIITPGWTLPEPTVTGGPCASASTTLTWDSVISNSSFPVATIPGLSGDIFIRYTVQVESTINPGTSLINGAHIETDIPEDPIYPNDTGVTVTTPLADPYVEKSVQLNVNPGANADYNITYGNNTKQSLSNAYIIDTLPDYNGDGKSDMKIISVAGTNSEQFYYNSAPTISPPTFDLNNPTANGWNNTWSTTTNHIAIVTGALPAYAGPFNVSITLEATDPLTDIELPAGISLTNTAQIFLPIGINDQDYTNNTDQATVVTPGIDLWVQKTGSVEGGFPGVAPGDAITYTVAFGNQGTVNACDVFIDDVFSSTLNEPAIFHNAGNLFLTDISGNQVFPQDLSGNPIFTPVNITVSGSSGNHTFQIGNSSTCLPPGSMAEFEVYSTVDTGLADGSIVSNQAVIGENSPDVEDILSNNTDSSQTVVYRADLTIQKSGISLGPDGILGTGDDSPTQTAIGENVHYTLEYNNIGSAPAQNSVITETIPAGMCYIDGSITGYPADATIEFSNNNAVSYGYTPIGPVDCSVTHFKVVFGSPIYPGNSVGEDLTIGALGIQTNVVQSGSAGDAVLKLSNTVVPINFPVFNNIAYVDDFLRLKSDDQNNLIDLNGDGLPEVALEGNNSSVIYRNTSVLGNPSFDTGSPFNSLRTGPIIYEDLDNDGLKDMIHSYPNDDLSTKPFVAKNTSTASTVSFASGTTITSLPQNTNIHAVADFNNDGFKDLLFDPNIDPTGPNNNPMVVKNISTVGNLVIEDAATYAGGIYIRTDCVPYEKSFSLVEDLDGDGKKDIMLFCQSKRLTIYRNTTDTSSPANPITFVHNGGIFPLVSNTVAEFIDFNNDGKKDMVYSFPGQSLVVWENTSTSGAISFVPRLNYTDTALGTPESNIKLTDIDNDGFVDIAFQGVTSTGVKFPAFFRNETSSNGATISFSSINKLPDLPASVNVFGLEIEDIDNDGKKDFVVGITNTGISSGVLTYRNTTSSPSNLTFDTAFATPTNSNTSAVGLLVVDIDGNGKKDFVTASGNGSQSVVFENISIPNAINFGDVISLSATEAQNDPVFKDLDGDGKKDLFIRSAFGYPGIISSVAFRNNSVPGVISFGENISNGNYTVPITLSGGGFWQRLQVSHDVPSGTDLNYTIYDATCGGTALIATTTLPNQFIDISSLGNTPNVCLVINFTTASVATSPILDGWQMTYSGGSGQTISFDLQVSTLGNAPQTMINTVTIQTDSYEIDTDNNSDEYTISMTQADVEIVKTVNLASASPGDTLIYTLNYTNHGPLEAHNVLIEDTMPLGVTPNGTWTQLSGIDPINCLINYGANTISCFGVDSDNNPLSDWVLSPGESGSIQFEATISSGGTSLAVSHTSQSDFDSNDGTSNISTATIPGSIIPENADVPIDLSASSVDLVFMYVYDENFIPIEETFGSPSDLVNFSLISLSPLTFQYIGPTPVTISSFSIYLQLSGGITSIFNFGLSDTNSDNIADYYYGATDVSTFEGSMAGPLDLGDPLVLQITGPGYSNISNPGTVTVAPPAYYKNHFDMPATVCPVGNRHWGLMNVDMIDPDGSVVVYLSDSPSYVLAAYNPSMTVEDTFITYLGFVPSTIYYQININRTDINYFPEIKSVSVDTDCESSVSPGTVLINNSLISTSTRDTDVANNTSSAVTIIGDISNLSVVKTGPTQASIGSNLTYTIEVENNGNVPAQNVVVTDTLPTQVTYVSTSSSGPISFNCVYNTGILNCTGSGDLDPGEVAILSVTVNIPNNITLIGDVLHNEVIVATTTLEVTVVDNFDEYDVTIAPLGNSSISGFVYVDANANNRKDAGETGISNISVFIAGKDMFGNVYGPNKAVEPLIYEEAMNRLIATSLIPNLPYLATDPYPSNYLVINSNQTSVSGSWIFSNFNPGTYTILELHPVSYVSTGSNAGYSNTDILGNPIFDIARDGIGSFESGLSSDENVIYRILLAENQNAVQYNFGEINGAIGDLIFEDQNADGTFNGSDVGIAGVQVNLYADLNSNGVVDAGETSQTTTTDSNGNYLFNGLTIGAQYIVEVVDSIGTLASYNAILGPNPGANNNSQNPNGYVVMLSLGNSINLTADFGYHSPNVGCVGPSCGGGGGGGCTGPNCNPTTPTGAIGNQVFLDENANGIFDSGEIGIPGVMITLYTDVNSNGRVDPWDQETSMLTNQDGVYQFVGLDINYQYIVVVVDRNGVLSEFTPILGPNQGLDNHSKNEDGYLVGLSALSPSNQTADFGYIGYELPRTGQPALSKILFGIILITVTILTLWFFKEDRILTKVVKSFNIKSNGKS